jgi:hypothetical protein
MQLNIEVVNVTKTEKARNDGKGTYDVLEVIYKNERDGKVDGKKLMGFASPKEVFNKLLAAGNGDRFAITMEKNDKGYWDWKEIATQTDTPKAAAASPAAASTAAVRGNYETPEERAQRQVYIVRQSSIGHALTFHAGKDVSLTEVLATAKEFVNFVMPKATDGGLTEMQDDIPF